MFKVDYKKLRLSFNEFHDLSDKDMPQYGEYCLLELKTGAYTAGGVSQEESSCAEPPIL